MNLASSLVNGDIETLLLLEKTQHQSYLWNRENIKRFEATPKFIRTEEGKSRM